MFLRQVLLVPIDLNTKFVDIPSYFHFFGFEISQKVMWFKIYECRQVVKSMRGFKKWVKKWIPSDYV